MHTQSGEPEREYQRRYREREALLKLLMRRESLIANGRLLLFVAGLVCAWLAFGPHALHPAWLAVSAAVFVALIVIHERVLQSIDRAKNGMAYYVHGLARIEDCWMSMGWDGADLAPKDHPYAGDLDLFGAASLFQLLCTAQTRAGAKCLADWLCSPASADEVRARQHAVKELQPRIDLREELAHLGRNIRTNIFPEAIAAWSSEPRTDFGRAIVAAAFVVPAAAIASVAAALFFSGPLWIVTVFAAILLALHGLTRKRVQQILKAADEPGRELAVVGRVLVRLEREHFEDPYLRALQAELREQKRPASHAIDRLQRLLRTHEASMNMFFGPIAFFTMWSFHFARAVDAWRAMHGQSSVRWLNAVGRLEALCALSSYAYEHPRDPFPTITDTAAVFDGKGLGHPLLPDAIFVRNDVALDDSRRILIVSGSNMSGKSVLLRTVGINVVLAMAGAPVRAHSLSLSPLMVGATLNIHDSIQDGFSRFYAEIKRIRMLMEIAQGPASLLFLLDEIFHGTNSKDRRVGAHAVLGALLDADAIGIITTHDLAIAELVKELDGKAANVHLEDHVENDNLVFDYKLRPGVVEKSNALYLMRAIGLRVDEKWGIHRHDEQ